MHFFTSFFSFFLQSFCGQQHFKLVDLRLVKTTRLFTYLLTQNFATRRGGGVVLFIFLLLRIILPGLSKQRVRIHRFSGLKLEDCSENSTQLEYLLISYRLYKSRLFSIIYSKIRQTTIAQIVHGQSREKSSEKMPWLIWFLFWIICIYEA